MVPVKANKAKHGKKVNVAVDDSIEFGPVVGIADQV